ncbi:MAG: hypothetical protein LBR39_02990, partial [Coriobacteriales bacterium]|nr:hypothetical protein [Coriobacteriales bacterium]
ELLGLNMPSDSIIRIKRGRGCNSCNNTGYKGRTAIHEIVYVDKRMQRMIAEGAPMSELYAYARQQQGMASLRDRARSLVLAGVTSMEEFLKIGESVD